MKSLFVISMLAAMVFIGVRCSTHAAPGAPDMKDLDEHMLDMMAYHDNLGLYIRRGDADYALWLLEGMDSRLQVIARHFTTHRKLKEPFETAYRDKLKSPIRGIRSALEKNDLVKATEQYRLLTRKCNSCHTDNDINKEVMDHTRE